MIELVMILAVVAILSAVAVPAMREFGVRAAVRATNNDLVVALNMARSEAVKRGRDVAVIAVAGDWSGGWRVEVDGLGEVVSRRGAVDANYRVLGAATGAGAPADRVVFGATGALRIATAYDFSICRPSFSPDPRQSLRVSVAATGTISSRRDTTSAPAGSCS